MAQGQRLEPEPSPEIILTGINAKQHVLMTNPVAAFPVYSRLIGSDHSGQESLAVEILPDVLGPLVDIEIKAHAVAGPVAEVAL